MRRTMAAMAVLLVACGAGGKAAPPTTTTRAQGCENRVRTVMPWLDTIHEFDRDLAKQAYDICMNRPND